MKLETEIVVGKKGQITIPARVHKKFKIEEGTRLKVLETEKGILLKRKQTFWDTISSGSSFAAVEEVKKELDKLGEQDA